jgi:glycosyltransferase involved in cell wall biosynthesis
MLRQGLGIENEFVILTVADNQERKNLSRSLEIVADFAQTTEVLYWMVTRPTSPVGWKLEDYAMNLGIMDRLMIWERGIPFRELWGLYAAADMFLLTSKAEGLAMPVLEAMATRLPVTGTKCAAIKEHLQDHRGLLIKPDYIHVDPWGNSNRYMASREDGLFQLQLWKSGMKPQDKIEMLNRAQHYVEHRTWDEAGRVLVETVEATKKERMQTGETVNLNSMVEQKPQPVV